MLSFLPIALILLVLCIDGLFLLIWLILVLRFRLLLFWCLILLSLSLIFLRVILQSLILMKRPRVKKSRNYDLCDARLGVQNMYVVFIHATGREVIVAASSPETAVSSLISWLHYRGLDSSVMLLRFYEANDVLSSSDLMYQAELMRNDPSIF